MLQMEAHIRLTRENVGRCFMTWVFHAKHVTSIALLALSIFQFGCTDSTESISGTRQTMRIQIDNLLASETYAEALNKTADSRERAMIHACQRLEGKRKPPKVKIETIQIMQEVLLESEIPEVRAVAAAGLGTSGNVASVPKLLDAMEDDALITRQAAARSVARLLGWREGFNPQDPAEARAEAVERFRERWMVFEASDLFQVATDPEAGERAASVAKKRAKFLQRKERRAIADNTALPDAATKPKKLPPRQSRPSVEAVRRQLDLEE